jgi:hypothetical protein
VGAEVALMARLCDGGRVSRNERIPAQLVVGTARARAVGRICAGQKNELILRSKITDPGQRVSRGAEIARTS